MPRQRKRRKIDLLGTFEQFVSSQEERKQEESEADAANANQVQLAHNEHINNEGVAIENQRFPNIIGNVEDMQSAQNEEEFQTPRLAAADTQMENQSAGEPVGFKDITPNLKRHKRNKSRPP